MQRGGFLCAEMAMHPKVFNPGEAASALVSRYSILGGFDCAGPAMTGVIRIGNEQPANAWEVHAEGDELLVVLEGGFRMTMRLDEGNTITLDVGKDEVLFIPRNIPHSAELLSPCVSVFFITPRTGNREWIE
jgi:mannose-6-phosphate isomerase-like protein (cupin superfamily)